jgi:hypothetical protein
MLQIKYVIIPSEKVHILKRPGKPIQAHLHFQVVAMIQENKCYILNNYTEQLQEE